MQLLVVGVRKVYGPTPLGLTPDTGVQEPIGKDEPNTDCSFCCNVSLCRFTDPKVSRKITSILKTMLNGSWTTWKEVDKSARDELWAHFKNHLDSVRGELKEELNEEMKVDLKEEMKNELKEEMHEELKEEMRAELKEEMKNELKEEMHEELKEEMRAELKEEMRAEIQDMLVDYGIKSRVTRQTKTKQGNASGRTS
uniref:Transposase, Ptta/En/Spm n=1 Tax=Tanacetum cinerariifolium TaxID=118510 RepID=A0A699I733_TANCI|nr:transposase, Ptta/En/Spm [Tanacetum cinerariifolium]